MLKDFYFYFFCFCFGKNEKYVLELKVKRCAARCAFFEITRECLTKLYELENNKKKNQKKIGKKIL